MKNQGYRSKAGRCDDAPCPSLKRRQRVAEQIARRVSAARIIIASLAVQSVEAEVCGHDERRNHRAEDRVAIDPGPNGSRRLCKFHEKISRKLWKLQCGAARNAFIEACARRVSTLPGYRMLVDEKKSLVARYRLICFGHQLTQDTQGPADISAGFDLGIVDVDIELALKVQGQFHQIKRVRTQVASELAVVVHVHERNSEMVRYHTESIVFV